MAKQCMFGWDHKGCILRKRCYMDTRKSVSNPCIYSSNSWSMQTTRGMGYLWRKKEKLYRCTWVKWNSKGKVLVARTFKCTRIIFSRLVGSTKKLPVSASPDNRFELLLFLFLLCLHQQHQQQQQWQVSFIVVFGHDWLPILSSIVIMIKIIIAAHRQWWI